MLKKRVFTLTLSVFFLWITCCSNVFAIESSHSSIRQQIFNGVHALDPSIDLTDAEIVPLSSGISSYSANLQDKAIRIVSEENGMVKHELLIPSKIDENGNLVNSFAYSENQGADLDFNLVDLIVYISCYYQHNVINMTNIYRPTGFTFRWNSGSSDVSVDGIDISYVSTGRLVEFKTGLTVGSEASYTWNDTKYFSNPSKNQVYYNWDHMMRSDLGLTCMNADYGGAVEFTIDYLLYNQLYSVTKNNGVFPYASTN